MSNKFKIIFFFIISLIKGEEINNVRMSIVPEYEQNLTTILLSIERINIDKENDFSLTLPNDVDSVFIIEKTNDGKLIFKDISYDKTKNEITVLPKREIALMIKTKKYVQASRRYFNYNLSFSKKISTLDIELSEPLMIKDFSHSGIDGKLEIDDFGQRSYRQIKENINAGKVENISFDYFNKTGATTITIIDSIINSPNLDEGTFKQKIKRYKIYVWETLIVLSLICTFVLIIILNLKNERKIIKCHKCNQKLNFDDLFCSKCGEKLSVSNDI